MSSSQTVTDRANSDGTASTLLVTDPERALHGMQDIVGRKWQPVVLYYLLTDGPLRFSELNSRVDGISSKMLSESLSALEDAGVVRRDLLSDQPVRVEYTLTERGESLEGIIVGMVEWGSEHQDIRGEGR